VAIIPEKTTRELGWPQILAALADLTRTPVGRELAFALPFLESREEILQHLGHVAEARKLLTSAQEIPLADAPDARPHLMRAAQEGVLEPTALLECARLIRTSARVRRFLHARRETTPALAGKAEGLSEFEPLAAEVERAIEPSGTLSDRASPFLAELRERTRGLHRNIKSRIDTMLQDVELEDVLRERYYTIRDDRYVLPVRTSHKARLPGIVHNASQTGQTLFVEPEQLLELGNQLTIAQAMALEEERRILADLTLAVGRRATELTNDTALLAELDRLSSAARLAERLGAEEPELVSPQEPFALTKLRHPLLALRGIQVIPNDVRLDGERRGLIISGPNAGGKTVTITAVGLSALMARAGLPIPAGAGSKIPLFRAIHTAIGDEGDLARDLSTFTAHLTALRDIEHATIPGTLVCIDEIAADTDPREGAALASALLEALVDRGAIVLITTHLDDVKAKGLTDPRFMSASVTFDFEKLAPTYQLQLNRIGASSAIEIARRVGLPELICRRAKELLGGSSGSLDAAVEALDRERGDYARLGQALDQERRGLQAAREEWDRQRLALVQKERELTALARRDLLREIDATRDEVRKVLAQLQEKPAVRAAVEAQQLLEQAAREHEALAAKEAAEAAAIASREVAEVELRPGLRVHVGSVDREGEILSIDGGTATIAMGALKTKVPLAELVPLLGKTKTAARFRESRAEQAQRVDKAKAAPLPPTSRTLDLRGQRTEDALREVRDQLDRFVREGTPSMTIIHGHGSGALKKAVREELESSPYAAAFRPGEGHEGGDGVTVVTLSAGK
jgi:DNA mismatch repair protein MutS2